MGKFIGLTNQFKYCPNAFRVDTYDGCSFGCKYCFANTRGGGFARKKKEESIDLYYLRRHFEKAFVDERKYKDITVELMQHKVPFHCGGMADPFQHKEFKEKRTFELIKLSNEFQYPIMFSTKVSSLPKEYWDILDPNIHAFQISLCGYDDDFIRKYETNTPLASERIEFIKELHEKGFWVSIRLQPLIDLEQAIKVIEATNKVVDFITVEHIKIPTDNYAVRELFKDIKETLPFSKPKKSRHWELSSEYKLKNIEEIRKVAYSPIGCADNDLHRYSDSRSCCGVDFINKNFNNYLKYNTCYFYTGEEQGEEVDKSKIWIPTNSCKKCMNGDYVVKDLYHIDEYVEKYIKETT